MQGVSHLLQTWQVRTGNKCTPPHQNHRRTSLTDVMTCNGDWASWHVSCIRHDIFISVCTSGEMQIMIMQSCCKTPQAQKQVSVHSSACSSGRGNAALPPVVWAEIQGGNLTVVTLNTTLKSWTSSYWGNLPHDLGDDHLPKLKADLCTCKD